MSNNGTKILTALHVTANSYWAGSAIICSVISSKVENGLQILKTNNVECLHCASKRTFKELKDRGFSSYAFKRLRCLRCEGIFNHYSEAPRQAIGVCDKAPVREHLKGEVLKARVERVPSPLLSILSDTLTVSGRAVKYRIATVPKKIELSGDGTYYDWETGVGVEVY